MKQTLPSLRKEIDRIDNKILGLVAARIKVSRKVARYKKKNGLKVCHPKREKEVLDRLNKQARRLRIDGSLVDGIFKKIMENSKKIQRRDMR